MSPTCLSGLGPHDRLSLLPSQVRCHQNIAGMLLASGLPISSGASPFDFLQSFRCAPTSSLTPTFPSSPVLPCPASLGGKLASRDLQSLRLPTGVKPLPAPSVASRILLSATSVHLCERQPATPGAPAPRGGVCGREDREGLQGSGGKGPPPRLLGWLRRSCEDSSTRKKKKKDSSTRKRRKAKAAETSQGELAENRAHQIR